ncbi:MAG TPA: hypothetical protein VKA15_14980 [Isosphaeraceae bacterium]|nr:hypothetical protein [Isosphaeraceae bacterium]
MPGDEPTPMDRPAPPTVADLARDFAPPIAGERWQPADDLIDLVDDVIDTHDRHLIVEVLDVVRALLERRSRNPFTERLDVPGA